MAPRDDQQTPLAVLGLTASEEALYRTLLRTPRLSVAEAAEVAGGDAGDADAAGERIDRLVGIGLVHRDGDHLVAAPPEPAIDRLIDDERRRLQAVGEQLAGLRRVIPALAADFRSARGTHGRPVAIEAVTWEQSLVTLETAASETEGDMLWMRAGTWRLPTSERTDAWMHGQLRAGRRSCVLYPARVLEEAPASLRKRAELGEQVRILGELPGPMIVVGDAAALIPPRFDVLEEHVLVVRQRSLIAALTVMFEALWERALIVPGIGVPGGSEDDQRESARRLILDQLARGAKDEQIARTLGLSLRTVRRRIADVMDELGVESRFQAGAEAVRRGWV